MAIDFILQNLRGLQSIRPDNYKFPIGLSTGNTGPSERANGMSGTSDVFYKENPASPSDVFGVDTSKETVYIFASPLGSSSFTCTANLTGELLLVGGGGGAGGSYGAMGGGGGGGIYYNSSFPFQKDAVYTIEIGAGGAGALTRGGNTKISSPAPIGLYYEAEGGGGGGIRADTPWPPSPPSKIAWGQPNNLQAVGAGQPGGSGGGAGGFRGMLRSPDNAWYGAYGPDWPTDRVDYTDYNHPPLFAAQGGLANTSYAGHGGPGHPYSTPAYYGGNAATTAGNLVWGSTPNPAGMYTQPVPLQGFMPGAVGPDAPQQYFPTVYPGNSGPHSNMGNPGGEGGWTNNGGGGSNANTECGGGGGGGAGMRGHTSYPYGTNGNVGGDGGMGIRLTMLGPNPNYAPIGDGDTANGYGSADRTTNFFPDDNRLRNTFPYQWRTYGEVSCFGGNAVGGGGAGGSYVVSVPQQGLDDIFTQVGGAGGGGTPGFYIPNYPVNSTYVNRNPYPVTCSGQNGFANTGGGAGAGSIQKMGGFHPPSTDMTPTPYAGGSGLVAIRFVENQTDSGYFID